MQTNKKFLKYFLFTLMDELIAKTISEQIFPANIYFMNSFDHLTFFN